MSRTAPKPTGERRGANDVEESRLPLPVRRCLAKEEAADYLGIGITLLDSLGVPSVRFGRRCVYDRVDLDTWLEEYKRRGRARKETLWPVKSDSTGGETRASGGSMWHYRTAERYAKALGLKTDRKR